MKKSYLYLSIAIIFEIIGTPMLKLSAGFTNLIPSLLFIVSYGLSFISFIFALKTIPLGIGYSIWAGLGTAGTGLVSVIIFDEVLSGINVTGLVIIIAGVVIMNTSIKPESTGKSQSV